ncbi:MAG: lytic murein transglycosylase B [Pseudomonadota bacterium]
MPKLLLALIVMCAVLMAAAATAEEPHPGSEAFVERVVAEYGLDEAKVRSVLAEAEYKQSIIDAMTRPAESKAWFEYRKIFMDQPRIDGGVEFWRANRPLVDSVAEEFGVPAHVIMAIVGVETRYGLITGSFRVIDALATLGFYYPRRADFFAGELGKFFKLADEEGLELTEVLGSYAGAMGIGQFIPSSYRAYAVDFDDSGSRDLWRSLPDALGSVANYLHVHGWEPDRPVVLAIDQMPAGLSEEFPIKPAHTLADLVALGIEFDAGELPMETAATVIELEQEDGPEYWVGLNNFYVITRYNRSPLYAMAVTQLSDAILAQAVETLEFDS